MARRLSVTKRKRVNMPTYSYKCKHEACAEVFEEIVSLKDRRKPQVCPKCKRLSGYQIITGQQITPEKWGDTPRGSKNGLGRYGSAK